MPGRPLGFLLVFMIGTLTVFFQPTPLPYPITANEVLRAMEMHEGDKVPDDKRTAVFAALTNLTKEKKVERTKPGSEYVYSLTKQTLETENTILV